MLLGFPMGSKIDQKSTKIVGKTFLSYDAKSTPRKCRKIIQHCPKNGAKMGPFWGQKSLQEACRAGAAKSRQKGSLFQPLERPPDGKDRGVVVVNEALLGSWGEETMEGGTNLDGKHLAPLQQDLKTRSLQASKETPSHQLKLLLHRRFHLEAPLAL